MSASGEQVRCPSCGGGQAVQDSDQYECRFCLTAFTFRSAREEEARVVADIKAWVEERVGSRTAGDGGGIDASSRAYLFQKNLLPALQTAFDRALETTLGFEQHPLLPPPHPNGSSSGTNPLLARRGEVMQLRDLRARLESPEVLTFAVTEDDRGRIQELDGRLQEIVALSNTAHAASQGTSAGFAAARHNLESILESARVAPTVAERYRALADLARLLERAIDSTSLPGAVLAADADQIAVRLAGIAERLQAEGSASVGASLSAVAAAGEAGHARQLATWLRSYDALVRRADVRFGAFVQDALAILGPSANPGTEAQVVESCAWIVRSTRGEEAARTLESFDWIPATAATRRKGALWAMIGLGFLGLTEKVSGTEEFFVPFWLMEAGSTTWLADASGCADPSVFAIQSQWQDLGESLGHPRPVRQPRPAPVPSVSAEEAKARVRGALERVGSHNAEVSDPTLALLPAAVIRLRRGRRPERVEAVCLRDRITLAEPVVHRLATSRRLLERFQ